MLYASMQGLACCTVRLRVQEASDAVHKGKFYALNQRAWHAHVCMDMLDRIATSMHLSRRQ